MPERALNPSHKINVHDADCAVPLKLASTKLGIPRIDLVFEPSVFLAAVFASFASVKEHARSITPILAIFSINGSLTAHLDPNLVYGVFIKSLV